ncbi:MAG TPA: hypothetical protein VFC56_16035, partial [Stellaceae bacterium]|nr:hypothetical protein [Stellaceae bacterium]
FVPGLVDELEILLGVLGVGRNGHSESCRKGSRERNFYQGILTDVWVRMANREVAQDTGQSPARFPLVTDGYTRRRSGF